MRGLLSILAIDSPIVRRDALSRARSWAMPVGLMVCLSLMGGFALVVFSVAASQAPGHLVNAADMADAAFLVMAVQLAMVLLFTAALAAGAIAGERERRTLDLLLVGEATPRGIAWAKVVAALAPVLLFMVAGLPLVVAAFLYAGLSMRQLALVELLTVVSAVTVASLAVLVSARSPRTAVAAVVACVATVALWGGTALVGALGPVQDSASTGRGGESVHPFVFANPFYAADSEIAGRFPSGAHVGRLVQVGLLGTGGPSSTGPVVPPWAVTVLVQAALAVSCVLLAGRALAGRPLTPFAMPLLRHPRTLPPSPPAEVPSAVGEADAPLSTPAGGQDRAPQS